MIRIGDDTLRFGRRGLEAIRVRVSLHSGTDVEGTRARIAADATLSPENYWLLCCSAILACIGLDVSSAAVIIGAMLISPLMGPIIGVGLGLGTTDRDLLQRSLRALGIATAITIVLSATYFLVSPLSAPTAELTARTRPTLLDVGVAFFGGLAGVIAGSRRNPSLALPGVAIATALMPPLCTAGFGLATGNWAFLFGAFYLYALNAVFIALATFLTVRLLRFPLHSYATPAARRREKQLVATVALLATLPSVYFLFGTVKELRLNKRIAQFVHHEVEGRDRVAPQWEERNGADGDVLVVFVAGRPVPPALADSLQQRISAYNLGGMRLELVQSGVSPSELQQYQGEVQREILRATSAAVVSRDSSAALASRSDSVRLVAAAEELVIAFPEITSASYARNDNLLAHDSTASRPVMLVSFTHKTRTSARRAVIDRVQEYLRKRLNAPQLVVEER